MKIIEILSKAVFCMHTLSSVERVLVLVEGEVFVRIHLPVF